MARAHFVKKARKDNPVCKKGESYYWWEFRFGGKNYSATPPRQSQLTQSEFLSQVYEYCETLEDLTLDIEVDRDSIMDAKCDLRDDIEDVKHALETLSQEQEDKLDNMPEQLQCSETGEMLSERAESCQDMADALDELMIRIDDIDLAEDVDDDQGPEALEQAKSELESIAEEAKMISYD